MLSDHHVVGVHAVVATDAEHVLDVAILIACPLEELQRILGEEDVVFTDEDASDGWIWGVDAKEGERV